MIQAENSKVAKIKTVIQSDDELNATNSKTQFAEIDGRKIAYRSIGKGDPIILCQRLLN